LRKYGYELIAHIKGEVQKKAEPQKTKNSFYLDIIKQLEEYDKRFNLNTIIIASPSFWKEDLLKELSNDSLRKKIILATCSSVGRNAIEEVLKRSEVREALKQDRVIHEIKLVEDLLKEISTSNLATYGIKEVEQAVNTGAVKVLLVTDSYIYKARENNLYGKLDNLMKLTESMRGKVCIINSEHDGGKKLDGLGGIAALLRYKLNY